jgi:hypothetical protein
MKLIIILYMPGYAGNFLTRLFSLSPETIPQIPIQNLIDGEIPTFTSRADFYSFKSVNTQYLDWQKFHRDWPDFHNRELVNFFNTLYPTPFSCVVYSMHAVPFPDFEQEILTQTEHDFYWVELADEYLPWVLENQKKLNFENRPNYHSELEQFNKIKNKHSMKPISLTRMLESEDTFMEEYLKIVQEMSLTPDVDAAKTLYHDWFAVRGPK